MIYFDNASTSVPFKEVIEKYSSLCLALTGNPSSANQLGGRAFEYIEKARRQIENSLCLRSDSFNLVFNSGATEANNTAIIGYADRHAKIGRHLITSLGEHPSVLNVFKKLERDGFNVTYLSLDSDGQINYDELKKALEIPGTTLVSLMAVNNETGTVYDINRISRLVHLYPNIAFMSDVTQGIGKTRIDFNDIDIFTMSGHKVGGLKSSGFLAYKKGISINPLIVGGGQEDGMRAGTLNAPLICSLATAIRLYFASFEQRSRKAEALNQYLRKSIEELGREAFINSPKNNCSPFILNFGLTHYKASVVSESLSAKEIYVTTQSACSSHLKTGSHVLLAMGKGDSVASNSIRLSFSGLEDIGQGKDFMDALKDIMNSLKRI